MMLQQWKRPGPGEERMTERARCRVTPSQRLRILDLAVLHGVGETAITRRALLIGLEAIEAEGSMSTFVNSCDRGGSGILETGPTGQEGFSASGARARIGGSNG